MRRLAGLVAVVVTVLAAAPAHAALPPIKHVFVIVLENKDYEATFGANSQAPFLAKTLPAMGALLPEYYATGHLSLDNYISMISGQGPNPQTQADAPVFTDFTPGTMGADGQAMGSGTVYPTSVKTIADQLAAKGLKWRGYMEDMANGPADQKTCRHPQPNQPDSTQSARQGDQYAARHNPFVYFHSLIDGPACRDNDIDLSLMANDISQGATTPAYSFITPNLCHDGHDEPCKGSAEPGGLHSINDFLQTAVPAIVGSRGFKDDGMLIVMFDEAESDSSSCCNEKASNTPSPGGDSPGPGGGKVGAVVISPFVKPGTVDKTPYNHYSLLRGVEDLFGLPHLGYAGQDGLEPVGPKLFNQTPALGLVVKAKRRDRNHVRFTIDAGRQATASFSGVCASAHPRPTSEDGKLTATVRHTRRGSCRVTVSRDGWQSSSRSFKLHAPR
ncbi:MAG: phosphatidylinositol-3-phosphatase [Thermoleophilaceae bacterium]|nr:phosphatidylinositol-3-phosphatase [Thermoleophilaceae bacterium]